MMGLGVCPKCGENGEGRLILDAEDATLTCQTCGHVFDVLFYPGPHEILAAEFFEQAEAKRRAREQAQEGSDEPD